jgi:predicted nucleic acid-binding protein
MTARVFVDTNVLVYARDETDEEKHRRALDWIASLWASRSGRLSWQVLHEYYVTVTRKLDPPRAPDAAREDVTSLITWRPVEIGLPVVDLAWGIEDRYGLSWWDALIVASAHVGACDYLLSEDLQDRQRFDSVVALSSFSSMPEEILGPSSRRP